MRILDRYVLKEMMLPLFFGVVAFTSLFIGADLVGLARTLVEFGTPLDVGLRLVLLKLPQVVVWTFPMAVLLAALMSLGRLSANSEIVAMVAGGVSLYRIAAIVIAVGLVVSLLTVVLSEVIVPATNVAYQRVLVEEVRGGRLPTVSSNVILTEYEKGSLVGFLYAARFDRETAVMTDVTMVTLENGVPVETTFARRVLWEGDAWYMQDGVIHRHGKDEDDEVATMVFRRSRQPVAIDYRPIDIVRSQRAPEEMTMAELRDHIRILKDRGQDTRWHEVQLHLKTAIPAASLIFALVGAPLGIQSQRSAASLGFGLSIIVIFFYYVLMMIGSALGQGGQLPPLIGAWLQNIVLGGVGIALLVRASRA